MADFGPKITIKIVETLRDDIYAGKLKSGAEIKVNYSDVFYCIIVWLGYKNIIRLSSQKCVMSIYCIQADQNWAW